MYIVTIYADGNIYRFDSTAAIDRTLQTTYSKTKVLARVAAGFLWADDEKIGSYHYVQDDIRSDPGHF